MLLSSGPFDIKTARFHSAEALEQALQKCQAGYVYLGQKKGTETQWDLLAFSDLETGEYFGIGLLTNREGEPHALLCEKFIFLGADNFAVAFNPYEKQIHTLMPLPAEFLDFIHLPAHNQVLIVHKKGAVAKSEECAELWRATVGPLSGYSVDGDLLVLERAGGKDVVLRLKNGKEFTK